MTKSKYRAMSHEEMRSFRFVGSVGAVVGMIAWCVYAAIALELEAFAQAPLAAIFGAALAVLGVGALLTFPKAWPYMVATSIVAVLVGTFTISFGWSVIMAAIVGLALGCHRGYAMSRLIKFGDSGHLDIDNYLAVSLNVGVILTGLTHGIVEDRLWVGLLLAIAMFGSYFLLGGLATKLVKNRLTTADQRDQFNRRERRQ